MVPVGVTVSVLLFSYKNISPIVRFDCAETLGERVISM